MNDSGTPPVDTRVFCLGQARSGTGTLYGLLAKHHRAAHEPDRAATLAMILRESRGEVTGEEVRAWLVERDRTLNLDYDIAWANQFLAGHLVATFPEAKFVILIRDPLAWLQSMIGYLLSREIPPDVRSFLNWWFRPDLFPYTDQDGRLRARGLYPLESFLNVWNRHIESCTRLITEDRRLVLRTAALNGDLTRLAAFLGVPVDRLDLTKRHMNKGNWEGTLEQFVDPAYLSETVGEICGRNQQRWFPRERAQEADSTS